MPVNPPSAMQHVAPASASGLRSGSATPSNSAAADHAVPALQSRQWRRGTAAVLAGFWIALFIGTHVPHLPGLFEEPGRDKVLHFSAFLGLGLLLTLYATIRGVRPWTAAALMWGLAMVYAAIDELLQIPVGRDCNLPDWTADALGSLCGAVLLALSFKRLRQWGVPVLAASRD